MTISANFPNVQPSLLLDFANAKQLPPSVTFTRATTATYYDGSTTALAEQNLFFHSQTFDNSPWAATNCAVTANVTTAPDGTSTADALVPNTTVSANHQFVQNLLPAASVTYTTSIYVKAFGYTKFAFRESVQTGAYATFDLTSAGSVISTGNVAFVTIQGATITSVGSGWYRVTISFVSTTSTNLGMGFFALNNTYTSGDPYSAGVATGNGTDGVYIWGAQAEQRSSATAYTVTTTQTITNYIPVLLTAGGGQPRFDHNPTTSESLGLLIEEQRTNLVNYSRTIAANWNTQGCSVSATAVAPDGTLTGTVIQEDTTGGIRHGVFTNGVGAYSTSATTWSVYAKAGLRDKIVFVAYNSGWSASSSAISISSGTPVGNGWYRITWTATPTSSAGTAYIEIWPANAASDIYYTGSGWNALSIWGMQAEVGSFATSFIPTSGASATRAADLATMTGVNFSSWFNNGQGTFVTQFMMPSPTGQLRRLWDIENTNTPVYNNLMAFNGYTGSNSTMYFEGSSSNSTQFAIDTGSYAANTSYRVAMAYQVNDFAASTSGGTVQTDTVGTLPLGLNALWLGSHRDGIWYNGYINKFAYYPVRVTNAQLQALSS